MTEPPHYTAMANLPTRRDLNIGSKVQIETKANQGTGRLNTGTIGQILTSGASHPYGIKVRLQDGRVGRVKGIIHTT